MTNFNTQARGFAQDDVNTYLVKVFTKSANLQSCGCRLAIFVNEQNNKI